MGVAVLNRKHFNPAWPDASNTGYRTALDPWTGSADFTTPNQVIEGKYIAAPGVWIGADNVTFRDCKFFYTGVLADDGTAMVFMAPGTTGTRFEYCEIDCNAQVQGAIKGFDDVYVDHCNIHHTGNGIEVASSITATYNYIHDIFTPNGQSWHADGIQTGEGDVSNCLIQNNTILLTGGETACVNMIDNADSFTYTNILVDHNLMAGGGFSIYIGGGTNNNVKVTNNHFSTRYWPNVGAFGIWVTNDPGLVITGNVIDETNAPTP